MCAVLLPPDVNPIAVKKYILPYRIKSRSEQTVGVKYGEACPLFMSRVLPYFTPIVWKERLLPINSFCEPMRCLMMTDVDSRNM